ncbi:MAG: hypothetical protein HC934_00250 [Acaryochloridaceae cyanobacterium SU_2_1]|nr:hypothetical protein [Acaryochloridaceae cyanobacterium SU_2_1]
MVISIVTCGPSMPNIGLTGNISGQQDQSPKPVGGDPLTAVEFAVDDRVEGVTWFCFVLGKLSITLNAPLCPF